MDLNEKPDSIVKWKELITEQEKSALTQKAFRIQRNLSLNQFVYHRSVIKSQDKVNANQKLFSAIQIKKTNQMHHQK